MTSDVANPYLEGGASLFAVALAESNSSIVLYPETPDDIAFLDGLAESCSPLSGMLPDAMIRQQAILQRTGHDAVYPAAMRRVVTFGGRPAGHIVLDWTGAESRCVDIAIGPAFQNRGIGTALLSAWLAVAQQLGVPATLSVRHDNPAIALYRRLGLVPVGDDSAPVPMLAMVRHP